MESSKTGILLINIGTPDIPTPQAVGTYLKEFLSDPFVLDLPAPIRYALVHWLIVPRRKIASAALYQLIWSSTGSPLLYHSRRLADSVGKIMGSQFVVKAAMRYGNPSIKEVVSEMREEGVTRLVAIPLYPQYSLSATESARSEVIKRSGDLSTEILAPFFDRPAFLDLYAERVRSALSDFQWDRVLFSFHGLPIRHVTKLHDFCKVDDQCCDSLSDNNRLCYRAQCFFTARELAKRLALAPDQFEVAFQSRLNSRWITPFSDTRYAELPHEGVKRLAVVCPSFVADCLETLEEVQIRGARTFQNHGGEALKLVPSLNSEPEWAEAVSTWVRERLELCFHGEGATAPPLAGST
ncbi:MAG: ferrochelatase [Deltaproteobacteria bacterium]|nr:ferrochelatase [Deltaproteobacteria bacterium]MBI3294923.1 ferrochelatase [Deltaproteobacteria bacterium]